MFPPQTSKEETEEGLEFQPKFDEKGLIPCVTISAASKKVLMVAYMNDEALKKTIETKEAHYWSRSRNELWHKGATSGQSQKVISMHTDCDQDCIIIEVQMPTENGTEKSCHTGRESCFYRKIDLNQKNAEKVLLKFT